MDSSLHLVPGRYKLPTAPGGKDGPGWEKAENKFTATSGLPACVCVLCHLHICTCVFQCVVCAIKNLSKVLIIIIKLIFKETCNTNIFTFHGYFHCENFAGALKSKTAVGQAK